MERDMIGYVPVNLETGEIIDDEISSDEDQFRRFGNTDRYTAASLYDLQGEC